MIKDTIMTNCQNKINTMSSNSSTTKSIFISLSIAIVVAYYGSSFFEHYFFRRNNFWFVFSITMVFLALEIITNVIFTLILLYSLSLERGYIALYYYFDNVAPTFDKNNNEVVDSSFVPYYYINIRRYKRYCNIKENNPNDKRLDKYIKTASAFNKATNYLKAFNNSYSEINDEKIINDYNNDKYISQIRNRACFRSYSIKGFTLANVATCICIIALFLIRVIPK